MDDPFNKLAKKIRQEKINKKEIAALRKELSISNNSKIQMNKSIVKIQKIFRGFLFRKKYYKHLEEVNTKTIIDYLYEQKKNRIHQNSQEIVKKYILFYLKKISSINLIKAYLKGIIVRKNIKFNAICIKRSKKKLLKYILSYKIRLILRSNSLQIILLDIANIKSTLKNLKTNNNKTNNIINLKNDLNKKIILFNETFYKYKINSSLWVHEKKTKSSWLKNYMNIIKNVSLQINLSSNCKEIKVNLNKNRIFSHRNRSNDNKPLHHDEIFSLNDYSRDDKDKQENFFIMKKLNYEFKYDVNSLEGKNTPKINNNDSCINSRSTKQSISPLLIDEINIPMNIQKNSIYSIYKTKKKSSNNFLLKTDTNTKEKMKKINKLQFNKEKKPILNTVSNALSSRIQNKLQERKNSNKISDKLNTTNKVNELVDMINIVNKKINTNNIFSNRNKKCANKLKKLLISNTSRYTKIDKNKIRSINIPQNKKYRKSPIQSSTNINNYIFKKEKMKTTFKLNTSPNNRMVNILARYEKDDMDEAIEFMINKKLFKLKDGVDQINKMFNIEKYFGDKDKLMGKYKEIPYIKIESEYVKKYRNGSNNTYNNLIKQMNYEYKKFK